MLFESVICTMPINPELIHEPKARTEPYTGFVTHLAQIRGHFNGTFSMSFGFVNSAESLLVDAAMETPNTVAVN